ncbi:efflux RND transporter periplasmic adaptor subunit [Benzoatithermus flavus]|uniref:Efflux RND transporter periplasmic adaptor subunit n=1 Tax=Benzoatithermus flavus TaxID=3108223 RepID=A0ABU8XNN7_9PROT
MVEGGAGGTAARFSLTVAVMLLLAACNEDAGGKAQAKNPPPAPPTVTVAKSLVRRLTEWDEFTGRFEPVQQVGVRARVSGYLQEVHFNDGDIVEAGQLLFVIDPRPYEAAADRIKAQIGEARAQLELARLEQQRTERLVSSSAAAKAVLDQRNAELEAAEAKLAAAEAQLRDAELNLGFTRVTAPFKGRISNRRVDVGNLVSDQTLLTTIVQLDPIYLAFDMSEADFLAYQRAVQKGELPSTRNRETIVSAHLVDEAGWPHQGTMNFVDNVVDRSTGTIRARAMFPNPDNLITPGQFGRIRIPGSRAYDALLIPDAAIVTDQSRKIVLTVDGENTVRPKIIRPGPSQSGGLRIVRRGLEPDDRIIIDGLIRARPGAKVTPEDGRIEPGPTEMADGAG